MEIAIEQAITYDLRTFFDCIAMILNMSRDFTSKGDTTKSPSGPGLSTRHGEFKCRGGVMIVQGRE